MKLLISAYSCETGRGSEAEIAWRLVHRLAARHEVWVITRANLRAVHDGAFATKPKPANLHFVYFDLPWILRFYKRGGRFFLLYYYLWQIGLATVARRLQRQHRFDILHHLIGGMDWMPSGLSLCPGPLIWGPVGSERTHPIIRQNLPLPVRWKDRARSLATWILRHADPFVRWTGRRADLVLSHTVETMPRRFAHRLQAACQTGIEDCAELAKPKTDFARNAHLRLVYAGTLKDWKGARLAVQSALLAFETSPNATLQIIGDGPLLNQLQALAARHPQGRRVTFSGQLSMPDLVDALHRADVFLYPSYHHGLATVVLQAMLTGLPIICLDGDATARTIGATAGLTVPLTRDTSLQTGLAKALVRLARDEALRQVLALQAQAKARREHNYDRLCAGIEDAYAALLPAPATTIAPVPVPPPAPVQDCAVTVIVCCYNAADTIRATLGTLLRQTHAPKTILVIDDGSTDGSDRIVDQIAKSEPSLRLRRNTRNRGTAFTRQRGLVEADTDLVAFFDADDLAEPNMIERLLTTLHSDPDIIGAGCYARYFDDTGVLGLQRIGPTSRRAALEQANRGKLTFMAPVTLFHRKIALNVGGYRQAVMPNPDGIRFEDFAEDLDLWCRMSDLGAQGRYFLTVPEPLFSYRKPAGSLSTRNVGLMQLRMRWIKDCLHRRRSGQGEQSLAAFKASRTGWVRYNDWRADKAAEFYKRAGFAYARRTYARLAGYLLITGMLSPKLIRQKLRSQTLGAR